MKVEHDYRDVLLKAASLVEQGWCQKFLYFDGEGRGRVDFQELVECDERPARVCLEGALQLASLDLTGNHRSDLFYRAHAEMYRILNVPYEWNDVDGRTADEVAEALRKAAE